MKLKTKLEGYTIYLRIMDAITWLTIFVALVFLNEARPESPNILDAHYDKEPRLSWVGEYVDTSFWILIVVIVLTVLGLIINIGFLGKKKHHMSYGMIIGMIFSIICAFLINSNLR